MKERKCLSPFCYCNKIPEAGLYEVKRSIRLLTLVSIRSKQHAPPGPVEGLLVISQDGTEPEREPERRWMKSLCAQARRV